MNPKSCSARQNPQAPPATRTVLPPPPDQPRPLEQSKTIDQPGPLEQSELSRGKQDGAPRRNRTGTPLRERDFESRASTSSARGARELLVVRTCRIYAKAGTASIADFNQYISPPTRDCLPIRPPAGPARRQGGQNSIKDTCSNKPFVKNIHPLLVQIH